MLHRGSAPLALLAAIAALTALALEEAIGQGVDVAGRLAFSIAVLSVTTGIANYNAQRLRHLREDIVRQQRRIDDLTTLDLDTGAYKQEWGENRLSEEVGRSTRLRQPFALLLVSVTNWNEVVADHGPTGATDMLRLATDSIKRAQRTPDRVWRAGPSELAMLLPGTPLDGAEVVATRTVSSILEDAELNVVIGVAVFPADGDNPLALIAEAFSARDFAKMAGMPQASRRMLET